jgi:hypothetical protein
VSLRALLSGPVCLTVCVTGPPWHTHCSCFLVPQHAWPYGLPTNYAPHLALTRKQVQVLRSRDGDPGCCQCLQAVSVPRNPVCERVAFRLSGLTPFAEVRLGGLLGKGSFGSVYLGWRGDQEIAVKVGIPPLPMFPSACTAVGGITLAVTALPACHRTCAAAAQSPLQVHAARLLLGRLGQYPA